MYLTNEKLSKHELSDEFQQKLAQLRLERTQIIKDINILAIKINKEKNNEK